MAAKITVTTPTRPAAPRPSAAERRAAEIAMLSTKQAELKHEAAQRRQARGLSESPPRSSSAG